MRGPAYDTEYKTFGDGKCRNISLASLMETQIKLVDNLPAFIGKIQPKIVRI